MYRLLDDRCQSYSRYLAVSLSLVGFPWPSSATTEKHRDKSTDQIKTRSECFLNGGNTVSTDSFLSTYSK